MHQKVEVKSRCEVWEGFQHEVFFVVFFLLFFLVSAPDPRQPREQEPLGTVTLCAEVVAAAGDGSNPPLSLQKPPACPKALGLWAGEGPGEGPWLGLRSISPLTTAARPAAGSQLLNRCSNWFCKLEQNLPEGGRRGSDTRMLPSFLGPLTRQSHPEELLEETWTVDVERKAGRREHSSTASFPPGLHGVFELQEHHLVPEHTTTGLRPAQQHKQVTAPTHVASQLPSHRPFTEWFEKFSCLGLSSSISFKELTMIMQNCNKCWTACQESEHSPRPKGPLKASFAVELRAFVYQTSLQC